MVLLWQFPTQKAVDLKEQISTAYLKDRASWKKSYPVYLVGWPLYYSLSVFKPQLDTQCRFILSTVSTCALKSSKKTPYSRQWKKLYVSSW